jgi:hypothetical protein
MLPWLAAGLALAAPAAAAETPTRTCAQRAEIGHPTSFGRETADDVRLGPMILGLQRLEQLTPAQLRRANGRLPFHKVGALVKASRVVTLSIAPASRRFARVAYDQSNRSASGSLGRHPVAVVIRSCPKDEPAFSYDGGVGGATLFPGGFITDGTGQPRCVTLELRVKGKRAAYRRTVPFGAIRC